MGTEFELSSVPLQVKFFSVMCWPSVESLNRVPTSHMTVTSVVSLYVALDGLKVALRNLGWSQLQSTKTNRDLTIVRF